MDDLTVIIASFGDDRWLELAQERAIPSLDGWDDTFIYHLGDTTNISVGEVRNMAVRVCKPDGWICFLDPDDELAPDYLHIMQRAATNPADLYVPALKIGAGPAKVLDDRDIINGMNPCPIGTLIHRDTFDAVGGFWNEPAWEDWSLFRRVALGGGKLHFVPDAIYKAYSGPHGRNSTIPNPQQLRRDIIESHTDWVHREET